MPTALPEPRIILMPDEAPTFDPYKNQHSVKALAASFTGGAPLSPRSHTGAAAATAAAVTAAAPRSVSPVRQPDLTAAGPDEAHRQAMDRRQEKLMADSKQVELDAAAAGRTVPPPRGHRRR